MIIIINHGLTQTIIPLLGPGKIKNKLGLSTNQIHKVIIYIIKQDIRIYVAYSRPNGWTDWAEIFCKHSWMAMGRAID